MAYNPSMPLSHYREHRATLVLELGRGGTLLPPSKGRYPVRTRRLNGRITKSTIERWHWHFRRLVPGLPYRTIRNESFAEYQRKAWALTKAQPLHLLPGNELRGYEWHLDHVLSIGEAFRLGLPPETVADMSNLRVIKASQNMSKAHRTAYTNLFNEGDRFTS